jgi:hypothetical protein
MAEEKRPSLFTAKKPLVFAVRDTDGNIRYEIEHVGDGIQAGKRLQVTKVNNKDVDRTIDLSEGVASLAKVARDNADLVTLLLLSLGHLDSLSTERQPVPAATPAAPVAAAVPPSAAPAATPAAEAKVEAEPDADARRDKQIFAMCRLKGIDPDRARQVMQLFRVDVPVVNTDEWNKAIDTLITYPGPLLEELKLIAPFFGVSSTTMREGIDQIFAFIKDTSTIDQQAWRIWKNIRDKLAALPTPWEQITQDANFAALYKEWCKNSEEAKQFDQWHPVLLRWNQTFIDQKTAFDGASTYVERNGQFVQQAEGSHMQLQLPSLDTDTDTMTRIRLYNAADGATLEQDGINLDQVKGLLKDIGDDQYSERTENGMSVVEVTDLLGKRLKKFLTYAQISDPRDAALRASVQAAVAAARKTSTPSAPENQKQIAAAIAEKAADEVNKRKETIARKIAAVDAQRNKRSDQQVLESAIPKMERRFNINPENKPTRRLLGQFIEKIDAEKKSLQDKDSDNTRNVLLLYSLMKQFLDKYDEQTTMIEWQTWTQFLEDEAKIKKQRPEQILLPFARLCCDKNIFTVRANKGVGQLRLLLGTIPNFDDAMRSLDARLDSVLGKQRKPKQSAEQSAARAKKKVTAQKAPPPPPPPASPLPQPRQPLFTETEQSDIDDGDDDESDEDNTAGGAAADNAAVDNDEQAQVDVIHKEFQKYINVGLNRTEVLKTLYEQAENDKNVDKNTQNRLRSIYEQSLNDKTGMESDENWFEQFKSKSANATAEEVANAKQALKNSKRYADSIQSLVDDAQREWDTAIQITRIAQNAQFASQNRELMSSSDEDNGDMFTGKPFAPERNVLANDNDDGSDEDNALASARGAAAAAKDDATMDAIREQTYKQTMADRDEILKRERQRQQAEQQAGEEELQAREELKLKQLKKFQQILRALKQYPSKFQLRGLLQDIQTWSISYIKKGEAERGEPLTSWLAYVDKKSQYKEICLALFADALDIPRNVRSNFPALKKQVKQKFTEQNDDAIFASAVKFARQQSEFERSTFAVGLVREALGKRPADTEEATVLKKLQAVSQFKNEATTQRAMNMIRLYNDVLNKLENSKYKYETLQDVTTALTPGVFRGEEDLSLLKEFALLCTGETEFPFEAGTFQRKVRAEAASILQVMQTYAEVNILRKEWAQEVEDRVQAFIDEAKAAEEAEAKAKAEAEKKAAEEAKAKQILITEVQEALKKLKTVKKETKIREIQEGLLQTFGANLEKNILAAENLNENTYDQINEQLTEMNKLYTEMQKFLETETNKILSAAGASKSDAAAPATAAATTSWSLQEGYNICQTNKTFQELDSAQQQQLTTWFDAFFNGNKVKELSGSKYKNAAELHNHYRNSDKDSGKGGIEYHALVTNNETTALAVVAFPDNDEGNTKEIFLLTTLPNVRGQGAMLVKNILESNSAQKFSIQANNWYVKLYYKYGLTKILGDALAENLEVEEKTHNTGIKDKNLFEYIAPECPQWNDWLTNNEGVEADETLEYARQLLLRVGEVAIVEKARLDKKDTAILQQLKAPVHGKESSKQARMKKYNIQQQAREGFNKLLEDLQLDQLEPGKPLGITKVRNEILLGKVYEKAEARYVRDHSSA